MTSSNLAQNNIDLEDLYQEVILEHSRRPRFKSKLDGCDLCEEGKNPLCGDAITVYCKIQRNEHRPPCLSVCFHGSGCSISQASASMMCEALQNVTFEQAKKAIQNAEEIYTGKVSCSDDIEQDVQALYGVSKFPVRIKCAALAWKTMEWLLNHHFDESGSLKQKQEMENQSNTMNAKKKLKVISTDEG